MRRLLVLFVLSISIGMSASLYADNDGRPDPTGKERYTEFGTEVPYAGARVVAELPEGATCNPANEMAGAKVWNSTRDGYAIMVELSKNAKVAVKDGHIFLCDCVARGDNEKAYNEVFWPKKETPAPATQPAPAVTSQTTTSNTNIVDINIDTSPVDQTPIYTDGGNHSAAPEVAAAVTAPVLGGVIGHVVATELCLDVLASTEMGTVVGIPLGLLTAWWIHHHYHRPQPEPVQQPAQQPINIKIEQSNNKK